ncbi:MAG: HD-GYP domain-containing protein [Cetobacterium sp.]|uniref:HD-GYP domain-containing protein n=1 Tax=Bacteria TaxID=2 RepID=UPI002FC9B50E
MELKRHSSNVSRLAVIIGSELDINNKELKQLSISALYHDIGKTKISSKILDKPGKLSNIEMDIMKYHPRFGAEIVKTKGLELSIVEAILYHHENFDGSGYPKGIKGSEIPLYARIIAIADAYDAMTNNRPYSLAKTHEQAIKEIKSCSGTQFDPQLVKVFEILSEEINSLGTVI